MYYQYLSIMSRTLKVLLLNLTIDGNYPNGYPRCQTLLAPWLQIPAIEDYIKHHNYDFISFCVYNWIDNGLFSMMLKKLGYGVMYATYPVVKPKYFFVTGYRCGSVDYANMQPPTIGDSIYTSIFGFYFKLGTKLLVLERTYDDRRNVLNIY